MAEQAQILMVFTHNTNVLKDSEVIDMEVDPANHPSNMNVTPTMAINAVTAAQSDSHVRGTLQKVHSVTSNIERCLPQVGLKPVTHCFLGVTLTN